MTKFLAWVDLETTGGDERRDPIIEAAMIITDRALVDLRTLSLVINPVYSGPRYGDWKQRLDAEPVVKQMHTANGLLRDLSFGMSLAEAQNAMIETLEHYGAKGEFLLAGSGVSHFDRRMLVEQMPRFDSWLVEGKSLDVGHVRRFIRDIAERPDLIKREAAPSARKAHRALRDIQAHLAEARHYQSAFQDATLPEDEIISLAAPSPVERPTDAPPACSRCTADFGAHQTFQYASDVPAGAVEANFPGVLVRGLYCRAEGS
jgi:oligoribonuclease